MRSSLCSFQRQKVLFNRVYVCVTSLVLLNYLLNYLLLNELQTGCSHDFFFTFFLLVFLKTHTMNVQVEFLQENWSCCLPFLHFSSQFVLYSCFCLLMKKIVYLYVIIYCYLFSCIFYVESDCIVSKRCYGKVIVKFKVACPSNIFGKSDGNFCSAVKTNVLNWDFFSSCVCKCYM